jgi:hypothetical protein
MSPALTVAAVVVVAVAGYLWGRWARATDEDASPIAAGTRHALADIERRLSRLERDYAAAGRTSTPVAAASRRPAGMPAVSGTVAPSPASPASSASLASPASWGPAAPAAAPSPGPWGPASSTPAAPASDPWGTPSAAVPVEPASGVDELARLRSAPRRRSSLEARRHYEALADEVARERRLAEYHSRATGTESAGARVVRLPTRPGPGARVRRYRADQRA